MAARERAVHLRLPQGRAEPQPRRDSALHAVDRTARSRDREALPARRSRVRAQAPMNLPALRFALALIAVLSVAARADDASDPEIERRSFKVADGFEVNLWAADPL